MNTTADTDNEKPATNVVNMDGTPYVAENNAPPLPHAAISKEADGSYSMDFNGDTLELLYMCDSLKHWILSGAQVR